MGLIASHHILEVALATSLVKRREEPMVSRTRPVTGEAIKKTASERGDVLGFLVIS